MGSTVQVQEGGREPADFNLLSTLLLDFGPVSTQPSPWARASTLDPTSQFISIYPQTSHLQLSNLTAQAPDLLSKPLGSSLRKACALTVAPSLQSVTFFSLRQALLLSVEHGLQVRLVGHQILRIHLSLPPQC